MNPSDLRNTMYLYEADLALATLDERFSAGTLKPLTPTDQATVEDWRTTLHATPTTSKADCLTLVQSALTFLTTYVNVLSGKDYGALQSGLLISQTLCQS